VRSVSFPFELAAEFLPNQTKQADEVLNRLVQDLPPSSPEFDAIIHRCDSMKRVVAMARRLAARNVPVLIQGESGTGKELFARAIHQAGTRQGR
jgi:transcriptional regulator with PAS, ATPase and Fis domain